MSICRDRRSKTAPSGTHTPPSIASTKLVYTTITGAQCIGKVAWGRKWRLQRTMRMVHESERQHQCYEV